MTLISEADAYNHRRLCKSGESFKSLRFGIISFSCGQGSNRGGMKPVDFIKEEFRGRKIQVLREDRTSVVRLIMSCFKDNLVLNYRLVTRIRAFCRRNKLSNAETHAILMKLGYRYRIQKNGTINNRNLDHMLIDGYWDDKP